MAKRPKAGIEESGEPALLRNQGCLLLHWSSTWIIGDLSLTPRRLAFSQSGRFRFEVPLADIIGLSVKRRKFVLLFKEIIQVDFVAPGKTKEKHLWFITPNLNEWLGKLEMLTNVKVEPRKVPDPPSGLLSSQSSGSRWLTPEKNRNSEPMSVREDQVRDLAEVVGWSGACILWHLWQRQHADIEELAALIDAPTHMDLLALLREGINEKACRMFGSPVLWFREQALDPETGHTVCFQWWLQKTIEPLQKDNGQPLVEIHDEGKELLVVAVMSRTSEKQPHMVLNGSSLLLSAESADKPWEMTVLLPCEVLDAPVSMTFINGMLSLRLAKKPGSEELWNPL